MAEELSVRQVIEKLQAYPQDAIMVTEGANYDLWPAALELREVERHADGILTEDWYRPKGLPAGEKVKVVVVE